MRTPKCFQLHSKHTVKFTVKYPCEESAYYRACFCSRARSDDLGNQGDRVSQHPSALVVHVAQLAPELF